MPWCPHCSTEISTQKRKCPECANKVSKGPGFTVPVEYLNREWFAVRSVESAEEAESVREYLESLGLDVAIQNGNGTPKKKPAQSSSMENSMLVLVPSDVASRAAEILRSGNWHGSENLGGIDLDFETDEHAYDYDDSILYDDHEIIGTNYSLDCYDDFDNL